MQNVNDIRNHFKNELKSERFTTDKTGAKTIEMIGASFLADEPAIFGTVNDEYICAEIDWYESESTNIHDIQYGPAGHPPAAWQYAANNYGEINSNYGHLIFSPKYFNQFERAKQELINNRDSRRAIMIYNRPSIWVEFNENGKNDFICTNAVSYYIRDNKLHTVVQMRSNDVVYGYKNDFAWTDYVRRYLHTSLFTEYPYLELGHIVWQVQNLHVYEKHFNLVK